MLSNPSDFTGWGSSFRAWAAPRLLFMRPPAGKQQLAACFWQQEWLPFSAAREALVLAMKRTSASSANGCGSTPCSAAQTSFSVLEKQQQWALHSAASWQPQARSMQGKGIERSFGLPTGNGTPTAPAISASAAALTKPPRNALRV